MKRLETLFALCTLTLMAAPALARGPGTIKFDEATFEVAESAGQAVITVERSGGEDGAVTVHYATSDGTATAGQDYTAASGTLSWAAGDETRKTFTVPITDDATAEPVETIHLTLSSPTGGATIDSARGTSDLLILASDGGSGGGGDDNGGDDGGHNGGAAGTAGTIKFDQSDFQVLENGGQAVVTVERSHGEHGAVTVHYATSDGTATAGQDYTATSGTLSWADGDGSNKVILVPILDDTATEGTETVQLTLSAPTGGASLDGERSTALLSILEGGRSGDDNGDDHNHSLPGTIKFDERSFQAIESAGVARVAVERSGGDHGVVSVRFQTADGSAKAGEDYTVVSTILTWANGDESRKIVEIPITNDAATEGNETVMLSLTDPTGGATVDTVRGEAVLNILDDDGSTAPCEPGDDRLCLAGGRFEVQITWRTGTGLIGAGHGAPLSASSGTFWFFDASNAEMLIKVLDACQGFNAFWVYFAATTDVDFTATVTDTRTGIVKQYANPAGRAAVPVQDTFTFATCGR
jgi:ribosomal protein L35AE/L33A